jgi:outer membrane protein
MERGLGRPFSKKFLAILFLIPVCLSACIFPTKSPWFDYLWPVKTPPLTEEKEKGQKPAHPPSKPGPAPANKSPDGLLQVTLSEAVLVGLTNNQQFQVERLNPPITSTAEEEEKARFDPVVRAETERSRQRSNRTTVTQDFQASTGVSQFLPTGTTLDLELGTEWTRDIPPGADPNSDWKSFTTLGVTQALLQGAGIPVNLANLRQARIDTQISLYELNGLAQTLTAEIETAYWDYFLALGQVDIYSRSLSLAQRLVRETRERISLGQKARSEIYFVQAEASTREQSLIDAKSFQEKTRVRLLRLISPPSVDLWNRPVRLLTKPVIPRDSVEDLADHIQLALRMRPDINQARLSEQRGELEIVKTSNGLLPKLDLFILLGRTAYARSFSKSAYDYTQGEGGLDFVTRLQFEFPLLNRKAKAQYNRSVMQLAQEKQAVDNLIQLAQQDVLLAYVEIHRAKDQMGVSSATVKFQREKRQAEIEKFRLGTSNAYQVAQTERDAVASEISALQARMDYLKGLTQFYVADGSLLSRRGIGLVPGG